MPQNKLSRQQADARTQPLRESLRQKGVRRAAGQGWKDHCISLSDLGKSTWGKGSANDNIISTFKA